MSELDTALEHALAAALVKVLPAVLEELGAVAVPRAFSVPQVAAQLDVSEQTVYRLIRSDDLATVPHLNPQRIAGRTLEDFLAGKRAS